MVRPRGEGTYAEIEQEQLGLAQHSSNLTDLRMEREQLEFLGALRLVVGFLGEQAQRDWWPSGFLAPTSRAFMTPAFARHPLLAQYHGVTEAAARVHDDHIGTG